MNIKITVQRCQDDGSFKEVYRNVVSWSDDIRFPFEETVKVLKMLYPQSNNIINLQIL